MKQISRILGWLLLAGVIFATLTPIGLRPVTDAPVVITHPLARVGFR